MKRRHAQQNQRPDSRRVCRSTGLMAKNLWSVRFPKLQVMNASASKKSNGRNVIASNVCELPRLSRNVPTGSPGTDFTRLKVHSSTRLQRFSVLLNTLLHRPLTNLLGRLLDAKGFVAMFIWISML